MIWWEVEFEIPEKVEVVVRTVAGVM